MNTNQLRLCFVAATVTALGLLHSAQAQTDTQPSTTEPAATNPAVHLLTLTSPADGQVFQRSTATAGDILVQGKIDAPVGTSVNIEVTVAFGQWQQPAGKPHADPTDTPPAHDQEIIEIPVKLADGGAFAVPIAVRAGGWHHLFATASSTTETFPGPHTLRVGVGEVFVVGGQSNSTNYGAVKQKSTTGYVSVFDGTSWTPAADPLPGVDGKFGSPWCIFGDAMAEKYRVPIAIVPIGRGSSSVRQWLPKGDIVPIEPSRTFGLTKLADNTWESEGQLFDQMVGRMKSLGPGGFRAMLWHQGESDAHQTGGHTLPGTDYTTDLERVIVQSRKQIGWNAPWFVAQATWGSPATPADPDIRAAQKKVCEDGVALLGPDTDTLLGENRQRNGTGVHMSDVGLHNHARLWVDVVSSWMDSRPGSP